MNQSHVILFTEVEMKRVVLALLGVTFLICTGFKPPVEEYYDSLVYLMQCVEAEAEDQPEEGKRLVCDVVLNRYNAGNYSSFREVIDAKGQFSCVGNGSILKKTPSLETYILVIEEVNEQCNKDVWYFRTGQYPSYGSPLFKVGDHYFSRR